MQSFFKSVVIENTENLCGFGLRKLLVFFLKNKMLIYPNFFKRYCPSVFVWYKDV